MNITITGPDGDKSQYYIESDKIIIGRGQNCDIVVSDDHISRKHLEVKKFNDLFFMKDLTLSNWISYNEEKLEKGVEIQYYDFAPLVLPGHYKVEISDEGPPDQVDSSSNQSKEEIDIFKNKIRSTQTTTNISDYDLDKTDGKKSHRKGKRSSRGRKKSGGSELSIMSVFLIAVVGFIIYQFFIVKEPTTAPALSRPVTKKSVKRVKRVKRAPKKIKKATNFNTISEKRVKQKDTLSIDQDPDKKIVDIAPKCQRPDLKNLCKLIFPSLTKYEGMHQEKSNMYISKNYKLRGAYLYRSSEQFKRSPLSKEVLYKIIASEGVMLPNFLKALEKKGITKVTILLFSISRMKKNLLQKFVVDVTDYRKYSKEIYIKAFSKIKMKQDPVIFNTNISKYLKDKK